MVKFVHVPEVTGYILAGVFLGPSVLGWVTQENLTALEILSEVALGLMLFSIGTVFELGRLRRTGRQFLIVTLVESTLAASIVTLGMLAFGQPWQVAFLLGSVAIATAPASTLMVIRETDSSGPLTDVLLGIIAINNVFCIVAYSLVASAIELTAALGSSNLAHSVYASLFPLVWQLVGSVALGYIVGVMLSTWSSQVTETGEMLILLAGSILLCVGAARMMDLSTLIASMAVGATMVNLSKGSRRLFDTLSGTDPPFYAIFFVLAGADLDLTLVRSLGWIGVDLRRRPRAGQVRRRPRGGAAPLSRSRRSTLPGLRAARPGRTRRRHHHQHRAPLRGLRPDRLGDRAGLRGDLRDVWADQHALRADPERRGTPRLEVVRRRHRFEPARATHDHLTSRSVSDPWPFSSRAPPRAHGQSPPSRRRAPAR